jgi:predicted oxidoreductase
MQYEKEKRSEMKYYVKILQDQMQIVCKCDIFKTSKSNIFGRN